jgi:hypothetical protein
MSMVRLIVMVYVGVCLILWRVDTAMAFYSSSSTAAVCTKENQQECQNEPKKTVQSKSVESTMTKKVVKKKSPRKVTKKKSPRKVVKKQPV